jgi:hypothetical protein
VRVTDNRGAEVRTIALASVGFAKVALSPTGDRLVIHEERSGLAEIHDLATEVRRAIPSAPKTIVDMDFIDGETIIFIDDTKRAHRAFDRVPRDPKAINAWIDAATNAAVDDRGAVSLPATHQPE